MIDEAIQVLRDGTERWPHVAELHNNLGVALIEKKELDAAGIAFHRAIALAPSFADPHNNLAVVLKRQGRLADAAASLLAAIQIQPNYPEAFNNLGNVRRQQRRFDEAVAAFAAAIELRPAYAKAYSNLGFALRDLGALDAALVACSKAVELDPAFAEGHTLLGNFLRDAGQLDEALAAYRRALDANPGDIIAHSNLVYALHFHPASDAASLGAEHREWARRHALTLAGFRRRHRNDRDPDRRIRVGYVSPDFRMHPVGRLLAPLLAAHDHRALEVFCYADVSAPDHITRRLRDCADVWRDTCGLNDEQLAAAVREDGIDVLVDLTMHMDGSRLLAFARKPAPVQVTYLAYCSTTGLDAIDYRLTDHRLDPGYDDEYVEESVRLPETYWCYEPGLNQTFEIDAGPSPADAAGVVTFGCLNNFGKVTAATLALWSRLLALSSSSRLLLLAPPGSARDRVRAELGRSGVDPRRVDFAGVLAPEAYLAQYRRIDVALDPIPFGGGTTTCDALWMGVPVVSLRGRTAVGRGGASILPNVGLGDLVAQDPEQYVRLAADLAANRPRLAELRRSLRDRLKRSPLMDAPRFARAVEAAFRQMWRSWCASADGNA